MKKTTKRAVWLFVVSKDTLLWWMLYFLSGMICAVIIGIQYGEALLFVPLVIVTTGSVCTYLDWQDCKERAERGE